MTVVLRYGIILYFLCSTQGHIPCFSFFKTAIRTQKSIRSRTGVVEYHTEVLFDLSTNIDISFEGHNFMVGLHTPISVSIHIWAAFSKDIEDAHRLACAIQMTLRMILIYFWFNSFHTALIFR